MPAASTRRAEHRLLRQPLAPAPSAERLAVPTKIGLCRKRISLRMIALYAAQFNLGVAVLLRRNGCEAQRS